MSAANDNDRYVTEHDEGWAVVKELHERASAVFPTQEEAITRAREIIRNLGGGELVVRGRDGKIRQKDTVAAEPRASSTSSSTPVAGRSTMPAEGLSDARAEGLNASAAPEGRWAAFIRKLRGAS